MMFLALFECNCNCVCFYCGVNGVRIYCVLRMHGPRYSNVTTMLLFLWNEYSVGMAIDFKASPHHCILQCHLTLHTSSGLL